MPTTANYGWTIPADTDLVKNGAAAIRTLGNAIDTTAAASFGKVVQIKNATYATQTNSTSATLADTGLTISITPTSASNKILVFVYQTGIRTSASGTTANYALLRGATNISTIEVSAPDGGAIATGSTGITYLDSPATTSATTYKTQFARRVGAGTVACQYDNSVSTITVMEVTP